MKKVYLARDLKNQNTYWDLYNNNSCAITGLSGMGKSYLASLIINQFIEAGYEVVIISSKAKVDFKQDIQKIRPLEDVEELKVFINKMNTLIKSLKTEVENSEFTHINKIREQKILIVCDELWETENLPKDTKKDFIDLITLTLRQMRYLSINCLLLSQTFKVSETTLPFKQVKIIISSKTDTAEASQAIFDNPIAYTAPLKTGQFIFWDRKAKYKIITIKPEKKSLFTKIWNYISNKK
jgi:nucleoside-triphosphatase THEP1